MDHAPASGGSRAASLPLVGSELAFDFTNTCSGRGGPRHLEHFRSAEDVLAWARHARVLTPADTATLARMITRQAELGERLLQRAVRLRDVIYRIGSTVAAGGRAQSLDLDDLSSVHAECLARARLVAHGGGFVWTWDPQDAPIEAILGPITLSALTLLIQSDVARIKQCKGDHCGWLFFDITKNRSRRWCEMEVCGNRAKQRRRRNAEHEPG
jgi:predicted RNA-binding Zn ribbon-like protein